MVGSTLLDGLLDDARVPLGRIQQELSAIEDSARSHGDGPRWVHQARHRVARHLGDLADASREFALWLEAGRDFGSGCVACEQAAIGDWHAERGSDGRAFEAWDGLFDESLFCDAQPHGALAQSLVPLVRLGKSSQARANHLLGYRITRLKPSMSALVGSHIEFCALTGNAVRGLELLAEHGHWLGDQTLTLRRAGFLGGVDVLLRVLSDSGYDDLPFAVAGGATVAVGSLREEVDAELSSLVARFDARNGTAAFSERLVQQRSRQPFLSSLELAARTALPQPGRRATTRVAPAKPRSAQELVAEARRLTAMWHPEALEAWRRVQATSAAGPVPLAPLAPDVQVELDEQLLLADSEIGLRGSAEAAFTQHERLLEISERYRALGSLGPALRAASRAAFALFRGGQMDAAASEQAALRLAAADALAGREITAREYMAVRISSGYQRFNAWLCAVEEGTGRDEGGSGAAGAAAREALAELGELVEECQRFGISLHGAAAAGMAAEVYLGSGESDAAEERLRLSVDLYVEGGAPWSATSAELNLSQITRSRGDLAASERYARSAVEHNLDAELRGPAAMMLAESIWLQDGRETEAVAPALAAAAAFARLENGGHDEARAQVRAAEALAVVGKDDEAVALFEPALRVLDARWEEAEWKPLIAQAARTYSNCLMAVGDPRRAAELLLNTAERVKDWPNQVPHAMMAADAATALERAGRYADAAAAFQRAADLWGAVEEPLVRIKCLRSAAWLRLGEDLDTALDVMDRAGGELVVSLADAAADDRPIVRYEIAETHMQRARLVLSLADDELLPPDGRERLLEQAYQEIAGAVSGLRRLVGEKDAAAGGDAAGGGDVAERLAFAALVSARIEARYLGRVVAAASGLRELAAQCEAWDKADLAKPLIEYADEIDRTREGTG